MSRRRVPGLYSRDPLGMGVRRLLFSARAHALLRVAMDKQPPVVNAWDAQGRELERRLVAAAEELLAHRATRSALVPMPGRLPVRCVAIGDLEHIRAMVRPEDVSA